MLTIICCYNNVEMLQEFVVNSLNKQTVSCNMVFIDTLSYNVNSAAHAYNDVLDNPSKYGVELTDYLLFTHQDIYFKDKEFLSKIEKLQIENPNAIYGVAGRSIHNKCVSNLQYMDDDSYITGTQCSNITLVESLDECCFAMTKELWSKVRFDEYVCNHWHLYAADFCYNARINQASDVFVVPYVIYHKNNSEIGMIIDKYFVVSLSRMIAKYKYTYKCIKTTCCTVKTEWLSSRIDMIRMYLKPQIIKSKFIKSLYKRYDKHKSTLI